MKVCWRTFISLSCHQLKNEHRYQIMNKNYWKVESLLIKRFVYYRLKKKGWNKSSLQKKNHSQTQRLRQQTVYQLSFKYEIINCQLNETNYNVTVWHAIYSSAFFSTFWWEAYLQTALMFHLIVIVWMQLSIFFADAIL